ncbi:hypothetical protein M431DRAFT_438959 [Trichoderma harzianum CBS 226.95]|uniref:Uncharacterized protein n=1 Tax=Trichoderma harzianum CBS 226.95 TaxID=983964 RepID=A0A2T4ADU7_TRIHA|nr:hypothetical protein M431DRAFT_438959 [Trichoderma harzianum CBS 226.95]PTB55202.1 hypothetical protein M431DRAFT_438959 [Trichoderma harzianum CBS 226.95]
MLDGDILITSRKLNGYQFFALSVSCFFFLFFSVCLLRQVGSAMKGVGSVLRIPPKTAGSFVWIPVIIISKDI